VVFNKKNKNTKEKLEKNNWKKKYIWYATYDCNCFFEEILKKNEIILKEWYGLNYIIDGNFKGKEFYLGVSSSKVLKKRNKIRLRISKINRMASI